MIKKIHLNEKQLIEILKNYNIGKIKDFILTNEGECNSTYIILTNKGKFIIKIFEDANINEVSSEVNIYEKLLKNNVPVPRIVKTSSNEILLKFQNKILIVCSFLEGIHIKNNSANLEQIKSLGETLGLIHKNTINFKPKYIETKNIYKYDDNWIRISALNSLRKNYKDFPKKYEKYICDMLDIISLPELSQGVTHGDFQGVNIMFTGNKVTGVIDFDNCFYGNLLTDLGAFIYFWCFDKEIDFKKSNCFIKAYQSKRKLTEKEKINLYDQTILFTLMHLTYWLWDKKNWNDKIKPFIVLNYFKQISRDEFRSAHFK